MTPQALAQGLRFLAAIWTDREIGEETNAAYEMTCGHLSDDRWLEACRRAAKACTFFPKPAEILTAADYVRDLDNRQADSRMGAAAIGKIDRVQLAPPLDPWTGEEQPAGVNAAMQSHAERLESIEATLKRDHEFGQLRLRGPALAFWRSKQREKTALVTWVDEQLDARIERANYAKAGAEQDVPYLCRDCYGRGCRECHETGHVCPTCRGAGWLAGRHEPNKTHRCPDCMVPLNGRWGWSLQAQNEAINRWLQAHPVAAS